MRKRGRQKGKGAGRKRHVLRNIVIGVVLFCTVGLFVIGAIVYSIFMNTRMETPDAMRPDMSAYADLSVTQYEITSDQGDVLAGYLYTAAGDAGQQDAETDPGKERGLVILSHGLGVGGHITYIDVIEVLAEEGFDVFAWDATGCDDSEGKGCGGFTQGVKDLDRVISFVEEQPEFEGRPILLWGHSWGAWNSMAAAYFHPEVAGIAALSGYDKGMQPLMSNGTVGKIFWRYVWLFNRMVEGKTADVTASDGLAAAAAPVFIAQGAKDSYITPAVGYEVFREKFGDDPRFTFVYREDRMHLDIYSEDAVAAYRDTLENGMSGTDLTAVDREKYYGADSELMHEIIDFYRQCLQEAAG